MGLPSLTLSTPSILEPKLDADALREAISLVSVAAIRLLRTIVSEVQKVGGCSS